MKKKCLWFSLAFRIILFVVCLLGVINTLQVRLPALGGDGKPLFLHFTTWTAWLCCLSVLVGLVFNIIALAGKKNLLDSSVYRVVKLCADSMAIVTFIIAAFVLPEKIWTAEYWTYGWIIKHFLIPVLTVLETVFFFKSTIKWWEPLLASLPMLLYGSYMIPHVLICRAQHGGHIPEELWGNFYPYGFTNIDKNGGSPILFFALILGLAALMIGVAYIYYAIYKKKNKKNK